ncbi:MAG TPA: hypothetical protein VMZ53_16280 [Kofleriaceae bacterium]|nr:hypothetical protein [Kofleriaceae bacterium]
MRAGPMGGGLQLWCVAACLLLSSSALAEPKPKAVDIKPFRDKLIVLQDTDGGTYVVLPGDAPRIWYGVAKKPLYEQIGIGRSADHEKWSVSVFAPRVPKWQPGSIDFKGAGEYARYCGGDAKIPLTELSSDKAKTILDKSSFMSTAFLRRPHLLARDDSGVYYYVDAIRDEYGGNGFRVLVGKKGALKQKPLTDIASDSAGDVFATKTGELRFVKTVADGKTTTYWVKGGKKTELTTLDIEQNERMIYRDLGVYSFTGSICENM